ncbi:LolA family protein [Paenibacillus cremeus]|uniref:Outer membrane lipoprotein carrier protein LolA n=1 Tax=Paenibacillus cremeus TaxID=2163881 RepID=A0A559KCE2_9BACL|nr:outer membrane lipoprotein carrier protein LolA [Paenibacillus cremeus]TVY09773.1 outer membrane lipoprotein carrier protein LolA [Paenibacillus cremeus]
MRRYRWAVALVLCLSLVLSGCGLVGKKDAGAVVKDLDGTISKLQSYHGTGQMTLKTGQEPQEYAVEVCFQAPSYYRISLTNAKKDITQIVLRNDDGVFVLTPHLNKSFRFQSDWPENQGQVYLYQSLVQSIMMDNERQFVADDKAYVFDVVANYQNGSLARQKVWLDKKSLAPQHVEVSDNNANVMVVVNFDKFEFGTKFEKDYFDMQRNMTSYNLKTLPTMTSNGDANKATTPATGAQHDTHSSTPSSAGAAAAGTAADKAGAAKGTTTGQPTGQQAPAAGTNANNAAKGTTAPTGAQSNAGATAGPPAAAATKQQSFGVIEPRYMPTGVKKQDMTEIKLGEDKGIMLRYSGKFNYTIVEARPQTQTVSVLPGDIMDLGFTLGVVTGDAKKTLTWTYDGVEFRLATGDLPPTEMIKVAQAVQGEMGK